jgi:hypothetical protein
MNTKTCSVCLITKPIEQFHIDKNFKDGRRKECGECKCRKRREARKSYSRKERFHDLKKRAKSRCAEFNLEPSDIDWVSICPVLGVELNYIDGDKYGRRFSPSVDRIDPKKGYTKGNVMVMSNRANAMKSDASPKELLLFAEWIFKTYK